MVRPARTMTPFRGVDKFLEVGRAYTTHGVIYSTDI